MKLSTRPLSDNIRRIDVYRFFVCCDLAHFFFVLRHTRPTRSSRPCPHRPPRGPHSASGGASGVDARERTRRRRTRATRTERAGRARGLCRDDSPRRFEAPRSSARVARRVRGEAERLRSDARGLSHPSSRVRWHAATTRAMRTEHDKKIAEIAIEYNRRLATLSTQYGSLLALVQQVIPKITGVSGPNTSSSVAGAIATDDLMQSLSHVAGMHLQHSSSVQSNKTIFTGVGVLSVATGGKRNSSNLVSQNTIADDQNSKRGRVEKGNTPPVSACSKGVSDSV